jgi:peptide/nickel transport system permease protein
VVRHIMPNALVPLITVAALNLANLLGGVVVVEVVFNWNGLGQLVFASINNRDIPTVQAALLITAVIFVAINLVADLIHMAIDPRVRPR